MAAEASRSSGAADSYIGSLISLTSKSEIRYEGVLFNINTEESSIGLKNVRSFGTEGRKKDGPQIPPNDKVYDYILFRGSDVKDLQVKSGPPAPRTTPIHNDPAIIQSHYSRPPPEPTSAPSAGTGTVPDLVSQAAQSGLPKSTFQGGVAMYPPGGLGSWGSSPAQSGANGSGVAMPSMYWQGYYGPTSGLQPHVQQPLFHPPPGMSIPLSHQQLGQYSAMNIPSLPSNASNLPEIPSSLLPPVSLPTAVGSYASLTSNALYTVPSPVQAMTSASDIAPDLMLNKTLISPNPSTTMSTNLPLVPPLTTTSLDASTIPVVGNSRPYPGSSLPSQTLLQSVTGIAGPSTPSPIEAITTPTLVTPGQLLQSMPATLPSSQSVATANKDVEVMQSVLPEPSSSAPANIQEPILPLPTPSEHKVTRATLPTRHSHKGRERGRGNGISRTITKFTEDFDFTAMNEKFKKDEVWGHLGKSKAYSEDSKDDVNNLGDDEPEASNPEMKPVYVKDDFFDSLSCNALDRGGRNGRTRFSEQMKLDTETFGDFPRNRGNRGGRGYPRGRGRGSYYGRGYGYAGRGRGQIVSSHAT